MWRTRQPNRERKLEGEETEAARREKESCRVGGGAAMGAVFGAVGRRDKCTDFIRAFMEYPVWELLSSLSYVTSG